MAVRPLLLGVVRGQLMKINGQGRFVVSGLPENWTTRRFR
jgi:hypothetical protein